MPQDDSKNGVLGYFSPNKAKQRGYYLGTFGQLLRELKEFFNAKIVIIDGILHLERRDWNISQPDYTLPPVEIDTYTTNAQEIISNYLIQWNFDTNDKNTLQNYIGQIGQFITEPKTYINKDLVLMKNLKEVRFPFAMGRRKEDLTIVEKIFDKLLKSVQPAINLLVKAINLAIKGLNVIIKTIRKILKILKTLGINLLKKFNPQPIKPIQAPQLANIIENRIGALLIENDIITVPKLLLLDIDENNPKNTKIPVNYRDELNVVTLWNKFHSIESFVPTSEKPNANQYKIYFVDKVPFCHEDYRKLRKNNYIYYNGKVAEVIDLKWNFAEQTAEIRFKINELYTNNLQLKILLPNGQ
jgi:hypothetical protein